MGKPRSGLKSLLPNAGALLSPRRLLQLPFLVPLASCYNGPVQVPFTEPSCSSPAISCPAEPQVPVDTCCMNYPAGHYLMTQFWDTSPPLGPDHSWTVHGLWPDYCNGGFPAFCDKSRSRSPEELTAILSDAAKSSHPDLLKHMTHYWLSNDHRNSNLWSHEWNKHGTCITTLEPRCYADSYSTTESINGAILDYFTHTTNLFSNLNTYALLKKHDILPSTSKTYTLSELEAAIQSSRHAQPVTLRCNSRHELDEIWYHFIINGPLRNASSILSQEDDNDNDIHKIFIPVPPDGQISNCPSSGIKYLPKSPGKSPVHPTQTSSGPSPPTSTPIPSNPFSGKGHLKVHILPDSDSDSRSDSTSDAKGCLIRPGKWYTSGTCATYSAVSDIQTNPNPHARSASGREEEGSSTRLFTLQSSYAPCAILSHSSRFGKEGEFVCHNKLSVQSIFSSGNSSLVDVGDGNGNAGRVLVYQNQTVFYADRVPGRFEKVGIFVDDGEGERDIRVEIHWEGV